jgi:hypothetical protein
VDGYETDLLNQGGVSGVTVQLSPGGYQAVSGENGAFTVSAVPPGVYTVTPTKSHWKMQPTSATIDIPAGGSVQNADFMAFPPGAIQGQVDIAEPNTVSIAIESEHPYPDNSENIWSIDAGPSASRIRLHFTQISTEPAWDFVYLIDGNDNVVEAYTADSNDLWTPWMSGGIAHIMLSTDSGGGS